MWGTQIIFLGSRYSHISATAGMHSDCEIITCNGTPYVRANPDARKGYNVD